MNTVNAVKKQPVERADPRRDGFASADEASRFLSISRPMVTKLVNSGAMPHKRFGRALRIPWSWLLTQVEQAQRPNK
jgi:excisionase family DNA binding protein